MPLSLGFILAILWSTALLLSASGGRADDVASSSCIAIPTVKLHKYAEEKKHTDFLFEILMDKYNRLSV